MNTQTQELSLVDEVMIEFGSLTCAEVSLESVQIIHAEPDDSADYKIICALWAKYRRTDAMIEKYGPVSTLAILPSAHEVLYRKMVPAFDSFIKKDTDPTQPLYLCICKESGDEFLIRRALPKDKYTSGRFMTLNCEYSKMDDCTPRNKLKSVRENSDTKGEYLLCVVHVPGTTEDRDKLRVMLDQYSREGKFALF